MSSGYSYPEPSCYRSVGVPLTFNSRALNRLNSICTHLDFWFCGIVTEGLLLQVDPLHFRRSRGDILYITVLEAFVEIQGHVVGIGAFDLGT